jgi:predicted transcriptional regulator
LPFVSRRAPLKLSNSEVEMVTALSQSRSQPAGRVQRASILLRYQAGDTVSEIARTLGTNRPRSNDA